MLCFDLNRRSQFFKGTKFRSTVPFVQMLFKADGVKRQIRKTLRICRT